MIVLGIESTCDETAAAIVEGGNIVRGNVVASQVSLHARYHGVVPEIASRAHIENILPVISECLSRAKTALAEVDAIAVAQRPGLIGSLLIGVTAAKTLAWSLNKPLIAVDHVHAHLYSVNLDVARHKKISMPAVGLVCSGGHTALYQMRDWLDLELVGTTLDDAVGEAYDKAAAILGLGYPGGPRIDALASAGNPKSVKFPRSLLGRDSLDFSFSGLKTAVLYHVRGFKGRQRDAKKLTPDQLSDVCAAFQAACVDVLVEKIRRAARRYSAKSVIVGGGVSANSGLRAALAKFDLPVYFPPYEYCTDNAAMIAALGQKLLAAGQTSGLDLDAITHSQFADSPR
ncbi:MAG: tRNA (adenosine(37)-N6)-threonylcarbamoyltransferase complex transferase subunit TsaD [Tepidisphaeraceae bacterium]|jgi:N6-L-threonylcarbamoyladenine synthase